VAKTAIKMSSTHSGNLLSMYLLSEREVDHLDVKRCRSAFAQAVYNIFSQHGHVLEHVEFDNLYEYPYSMKGFVRLARGKFNGEAAGELREEFGRLLIATHKYTVTYHRLSDGLGPSRGWLSER
jgi:hypothetical protein